MCLGGGSKTATGKFLLHFQNSKWSNRCRSVYRTDTTIQVFHNKSIKHQSEHSIQSIYINRSRGGVPGAPYGTQFFRFCIHFHRKVPTSAVHAPLTGARPPTGNPGSATDPVILQLCLLHSNISYRTTNNNAYSVEATLIFIHLFLYCIIQQ